MPGICQRIGVSPLWFTICAEKGRARNVNHQGVATQQEAEVYGNRTHWELFSNPPLVLKTRAPTRGANTSRASRCSPLLAPSPYSRRSGSARASKLPITLDDLPLLMDAGRL